jgi:hypothetical protein
MSAITEYYNKSAVAMKEVENIKYLFEEKDAIMEQKRIADFKYDPYDYIRGSGLLEKCKTLGEKIQRRNSAELTDYSAQIHQEVLRTDRDLIPTIDTGLEDN